MPLMFPRIGGAIGQNNFAATPSGTAIGTTVTSHASAHTKGNYSQLIASTNYDCFGFTLVFANSQVAASQINLLCDIAIGAAASESVIIPNLTVGSMGTGITCLVPFYFPMRIPKGTRIAARCQDAVGGDTVDIAIDLSGGASFPPGRLFNKCEIIGADTATSKGTAHTAGLTGAESTWTNLGSPAAHDLEAILLFAQVDTAVVTAHNYHVEIGVASTTLKEFYVGTSSSELVTALFPTVPHRCIIPAGTQLMIRAESNTSTVDSMQYAVLGFY